MNLSYQTMETWKILKFPMLEGCLGWMNGHGKIWVWKSLKRRVFPVNDNDQLEV